MFIEKLKPILKGYIKLFMAGNGDPVRTGGTNEADYCYSTWLRHLILLNSKQPDVPENVLELGPGDTLGIGIAALLSGAKSYTGLDIYTYWRPQDNVKIFDDLVTLFRTKASLPDASKYPLLTPYLDNYDFPSEILTDDLLLQSLSETRLQEIRDELISPSRSNKYIRFISPWKADDVSAGSVDFVFSQAVLQYADLNVVYTAINRWLKPGGYTAHTVDFSSHGITNTWNGHWCFSDFEWKHYSYKKKIILNRVHYSGHKALLKSHDFDMVARLKYKKENHLKRSDLAKKFLDMSDEDLQTHAAYMLSVKKDVN